jgi:hypothetical protein
MLGTVNKLGILGTVTSAAVNLGCCAPQALGPLAGVLFAGGLLDRVPSAWQLPLLYGSLAVTLVGFGLGWRRHGRPTPALLFLPGAGAVLYSLHEALDVSALQVFLRGGLGLLLVAAAWDARLTFRARGCRKALSRSEASR